MKIYIDFCFLSAIMVPAVKEMELVMFVVLFSGSLFVFIWMVGIFFSTFPFPPYSIIVNIKQIYTDWLQVY